MKIIDQIETDKYVLTIYECSCGFHIGIDTSYLDQVDEVCIVCPACSETKKTSPEDEDVSDEDINSGC